MLLLPVMRKSPGSTRWTQTDRDQTPCRETQPFPCESKNLHPRYIPQGQDPVPRAEFHHSPSTLATTGLESASHPSQCVTRARTCGCSQLPSKDAARLHRPLQSTLSPAPTMLPSRAPRCASRRVTGTKSTDTHVTAPRKLSLSRRLLRLRARARRRLGRASARALRRASARARTAVQRGHLLLHLHLQPAPERVHAGSETCSESVHQCSLRLGLLQRGPVRSFRLADGGAFYPFQRSLVPFKVLRTIKTTK